MLMRSIHHEVKLWKFKCVASRPIKELNDDDLLIKFLDLQQRRVAKFKLLKESL